MAAERSDPERCMGWKPMVNARSVAVRLPEAPKSTHWT